MVLPTAHGSGLFQQGETQVLNVTTLGMPKTDQILDNLGNRDRKRYMHHYNMPPHANGETERVGSPKRREIGHGLLAHDGRFCQWSPSQEDFPYVLARVRGAGVERLDFDGLGVLVEPLADGRRRAIERR